MPALKKRRKRRDDPIVVGLVNELKGNGVFKTDGITPIDPNMDNMILETAKELKHWSEVLDKDKMDGLIADTASSWKENGRPPTGDEVGRIAGKYSAREEGAEEAGGQPAPAEEGAEKAVKSGPSQKEAEAVRAELIAQLNAAGVDVGASASVLGYIVDEIAPMRSFLIEQGEWEDGLRAIAKEWKEQNAPPLDPSITIARLITERDLEAGRQNPPAEKRALSGMGKGRKRPPVQEESRRIAERQVEEDEGRRPYRKPAPLQKEETGGRRFLSVEAQKVWRQYDRWRGAEGGRGRADTKALFSEFLKWKRSEDEVVEGTLAKSMLATYKVPVRIRQGETGGIEEIAREEGGKPAAAKGKGAGVEEALSPEEEVSSMLGKDKKYVELNGRITRLGEEEMSLMARGVSGKELEKVQGEIRKTVGLLAAHMEGRVPEFSKKGPGLADALKLKIQVVQGMYAPAPTGETAEAAPAPRAEERESREERKKELFGVLAGYGVDIGSFRESYSRYTGMFREAEEAGDWEGKLRATAQLARVTEEATGDLKGVEGKLGNQPQELKDEYRSLYVRTLSTSEKRRAHYEDVQKEAGEAGVGMAVISRIDNEVFGKRESGGLAGSGVGEAAEKATPKKEEQVQKRGPAAEMGEEIVPIEEESAPAEKRAPAEKERAGAGGKRAEAEAASPAAQAEEEEIKPAAEEEEIVPIAPEAEEEVAEAAGAPEKEEEARGAAKMSKREEEKRKRIAARRKEWRKKLTERIEQQTTHVASMEAIPSAGPDMEELESQFTGKETGKEEKRGEAGTRKGKSSGEPISMEARGMMEVADRAVTRGNVREIGPKGSVEDKKKSIAGSELGGVKLGKEEEYILRNGGNREKLELYTKYHGLLTEAKRKLVRLEKDAANADATGRRKKLIESEVERARKEVENYERIVAYIRKNR